MINARISVEEGGNFRSGLGGIYVLLNLPSATSTAARRRLCLGPLQLVTVTVCASASQSVNLEQNDRALVKINLFIT